MKIFIDFDDVLFNTKRFKDDFEKIFFQFGIAGDIFRENYYNYQPNKRDYPQRTYLLQKHLKMIRRSVVFNCASLKKRIGTFLRNTQKYVFPDAKPFLKKFKPEEIFLISHGERKFQKKKIRNTRLEKYFSAIEISSGPKSQDIGPWIKKDKDKKFFLDDRVYYLEEVKKILPEIITILIQRPEGRYQDKKNDYCDFTAKNLKEALKIINLRG